MHLGDMKATASFADEWTSARGTTDRKHATR